MLPARCILIVDDEPNVRLMLRTALESSGYQVREAADGAGCLGHLRASPCDLVVLDLRMPKMDGMETLRRLRAEGNVTPVVMLTAHGSIPDAVMAMRLGAIDFLTKPITPHALRETVADVIRRQVEPPPPRMEVTEKASDRSEGIAFDLARAKRAVNRGEFEEAERLLRDVIVLDSRSEEAHELLDRLLILKEKEGQGSYGVLRDWFPSGAVARKKR
ncbi:MAG: response regulator [Isosphaeraceae bacterium]